MEIKGEGRLHVLGAIAKACCTSQHRFSPGYFKSLNTIHYLLEGQDLEHWL